eukprot:CAMPEP_0181299468 /NCGR_PEP_ID=MMETSP1101-20121128/6363_1 /TAXON_ID=46948 /ORGANISM="Rhodomonas abbreviata, Strain Caron Lab Isolate" /LENGTH=63 /DNA_ID=CAMNT_0023404621 /DNA_START=13 /DNA_END=204 /DNA_ORIENTATION=+
MINDVMQRYWGMPVDIDVGYLPELDDGLEITDASPPRPLPLSGLALLGVLSSLSFLLAQSQRQ